MWSFVNKIFGFSGKGDNNQPIPEEPQEPDDNPGQQDVQNVAFNPNALAIVPEISDKVNNPDNMSIEMQQVMRYQQDTKQRSDLSEWVKVVISIWLMAVIAIIVALGRGCLHLAESIIITLLVTTTANILGMAYLVLGDLFPKGEGALKTFMNR